jgi:ABC-type uncharacterized transport system involved in gliding motility auxiliary subunit
MQITKQSRRRIQLQNALFFAVLLGCMGLLAWLSTRYVVEADWSASQRNSLSQPSIQLLAAMTGPVRVTAFARENAVLRDVIRDLVARYQRVKPDMSLEFTNPDAEPDRVRDLGITRDGELLVEFQGRREKVSQLAEQPLTNALMRIARKNQRRVLFLTGHGDRDPKGEANFALGNFGKVLEQKGIELATLNLAETPAIPQDTRLLVVASPQTALLPGEVELVERHIDAGGNLLWLTEPDQMAGLEPLAEKLGIEVLPGTIVDASTQLLGINSPAFALVPQYPPHAITREMDSLTLFPEAAALVVEPVGAWQATPLLTTLARSWTETGPLDSSTLEYDADADEHPGPLDIGVVLTRTRLSEETEGAQDAETGEQRIVVCGDGDFLSNSYLGNGGNLDLGLSLFNWLNNDDRLVAIAARSAVDTQLELSRTAQILIGFGFLFGLPAALLGGGLWIWWKRRRA